VNIYQIEIKSKNEFEVLQNLVTVYSCYKTITGWKHKMLRQKLVLLLSIYIKYGYSKDSKNRACEMLDLKKTNLNCLNSELRDGGFLIKGTMNVRDSFLNPELQELSDYYMGKGDLPTNILFTLSSGNG
jgi:hypothetical protein